MNRTTTIFLVQGNTLKLAIPLTLRTISFSDGNAVCEDDDFIPSSDSPVTVELTDQSKKLAFEASMEGNVAVIEDRGNIPTGFYAVSVLCKDNEGNPYRFKQKAALRVVDTTEEAGITSPIEYEAKTWYLNAAIYLALKGEGGGGTVTAVKMNNGEPISPDGDGVVNLGTVLTRHQDISHLQDKLVVGNGIRIAQDGKTISVDADVVQPLNADGTFSIRIGEDVYIINLKHTHPQYQPLLSAGSNITITTNEQTGITTISAAGGSEGITGIIMNGNVMPVNEGVVNLGTVLSQHQTIPQSDWNETNSSNSAYIKNKPNMASYVTTGTAQEITGEKTFVGDKRVVFKQSTTSDRLGFTGKTSGGRELGYLEMATYNGSTQATTYLGVYDDSNPSYFPNLGFRYHVVKDGVTYDTRLIVPPQHNSSGYTYFPISINGKYANEAGEVTLLASDVGAAPVVDVAGNGTVSQALTANTFYRFTGTPTTLSLTLAAATGFAVYAGKFTAASGGCTLSLPNTVKLAPGVPTIEGGKSYEFSIVDNVFLMVEV